MRRREFITLLGGAAAAWPLAVRAQQPERMRRIGILMPVSEADREGQVRVFALQEELRKLGWEIDRNLLIVVRWAAGEGKLMRAYAAELVTLKPDLILLQSNEALARVHEETTTIPIVVALFSDPVGSGFVQSLARPGGNITGFANLEPAMGGKWLQQLKEIAPRVRRSSSIRTSAPTSRSWGRPRLRRTPSASRQRPPPCATLTISKGPLPHSPRSPTVA